MARAFDDDPFFNFLVKQDDRREQRLRRFMDAGLMKLTFPYGETYMTEAGDGAALWNPPDGRPHGLRTDLSLLPVIAQVAGLGGMPRVISTLSLVEKKHPKEPHYYLLGIGVDPARQGKGVGSSLLAPMAERLDREGVPGYLESSKERNIPLYERFGFRVVDELKLPNGPSVWPMWRDPAANG
ncbi:MAG: GNAT family N-acetyltransferase [Chloroflexi bacterium]|nr:GNAT family N-acetyltransferase [Chloroflexota bacterium]